MKVIGWLSISMVFFCLGEFCSKKYAINPSWKWMALTFLSYSGCTLPWLLALRETNTLAVTGAMWSITSLVTTILMGMVVFSERPHPIQWVGLGLALLATWLLNIK